MHALWLGDRIAGRVGGFPSRATRAAAGHRRARGARLRPGSRLLAGDTARHSRRAREERPPAPDESSEWPLPFRPCGTGRARGENLCWRSHSLKRNSAMASAGSPVVPLARSAPRATQFGPPSSRASAPDCWTTCAIGEPGLHLGRADFDSRIVSIATSNLATPMPGQAKRDERRESSSRR